jgi:hypothetical protein
MKEIPFSGMEQQVRLLTRLLELERRFIGAGRCRDIAPIPIQMMELH